MSKDFMPTKEYLEELRKEGHFAYTTATLRFLEISLLLLIFYIIKKDGDFYLKAIQDFFRGDVSLSISDFNLYFLFIPLCILPLAILVILFHSKFLFSFNRLFGFKKENRQSFKGKIIYCISYPVLVCLYFAMVCIFTLEFLSLLNNNYSDIYSLIFNYIDGMIFFIITLFIVFAVMSFVINRFVFLRKNKMSMEDILARNE